MSDLDELTARATLTLLLEHLTTAADATRAATLPWEAGEIAAKWIEHELAPLLEAFKAKVTCAEGEIVWSCPLCDDGEARLTRPRPGVDRSCDFSCGHALRIHVPVHGDLTEEQMAGIVARMVAAADRVR
jgi:hypothetical protein